MKTVRIESIQQPMMETDSRIFEYGEYKVTVAFSENGITLTEALVDYVEKMASLKFAL